MQNKPKQKCNVSQKYKSKLILGVLERRENKGIGKRKLLSDATYSQTAFGGANVNLERTARRSPGVSSPSAAHSRRRNLNSPLRPRGERPPGVRRGARPGPASSSRSRVSIRSLVRTSPPAL